MTNIIMQGFAWLLLERKIQGKSYKGYSQLFEESCRLIQSLIDRAEDNSKNRWELLHIIGMERWMQSRMRVALGAPFIQEEYDSYRPPEDTPWQDLKRTFFDVREASCDLCIEFEAKNVDPAQKIVHNSVGEMSVKAWMEYVLSHSNRHAKRMTLRS
jgi:hypothetical protein